MVVVAEEMSLIIGTGIAVECRLASTSLPALILWAKHPVNDPESKHTLAPSLTSSKCVSFVLSPLHVCRTSNNTSYTRSYKHTSRSRPKLTNGTSIHFNDQLAKSVNMRVRKRAGWLKLDFNVVDQSWLGMKTTV